MFNETMSLMWKTISGQNKYPAIGCNELERLVFIVI